MPWNRNAWRIIFLRQLRNRRVKRYHRNGHWQWFQFQLPIELYIWSPECKQAFIPMLEELETFHRLTVISKWVWVRRVSFKLESWNIWSNTLFFAYPISTRFCFFSRKYVDIDKKAAYKSWGQYGGHEDESLEYRKLWPRLLSNFWEIHKCLEVRQHLDCWW